MNMIKFYKTEINSSQSQESEKDWSLRWGVLRPAEYSSAGGLILVGAKQDPIARTATESRFRPRPEPEAEEEEEDPLFAEKPEEPELREASQLLLRFRVSELPELRGLRIRVIGRG